MFLGLISPGSRVKDSCYNEFVPSWHPHEDFVLFSIYWDHPKDPSTGSFYKNLGKLYYVGSFQRSSWEKKTLQTVKSSRIQKSYTRSRTEGMQKKRENKERERPKKRTTRAHTHTHTQHLVTLVQKVLVHKVLRFVPEPAMHARAHRHLRTRLRSPTEAKENIFEKIR